MLFIKRNNGQSIYIDVPDSDEKIVVKILKIGKKSVILGCDTPKGYKVKRSDLILNDIKCK